MQRGVMEKGRGFALLLLVAAAAISGLPTGPQAEVLFIGEFGTGNILKVEYEVDGQGVPALTADAVVFDTGITMPTELAMDGEGNLYVGSFGAGVDPESPIYHYSDADDDNCPDAETRAMILPGLTDVDGMSIDFDARQECTLLYLSAFGGSRTQDIVFYEEPDKRSKAIDLGNPQTIPTGAASIPVSQPVALALNPLGNLFVLDASSGWITSFRDGNGDEVVDAEDVAANDPLRFNALSGSRDFFLDMAFSSSGLLYALKADLENPGDGQILVFRSDKSYLQLAEVSSLETPFATLVLNYSPANGIAFDPNHADNGLLFVSSTASGSVKAFWDTEEPRWVADDPQGIDLVAGLVDPAGIAAMPFDPNDQEDEDGDGVHDFEDNCRTTPNAGDPQPDSDLDGLGDACDPPDCGVLAEIEYGRGGPRQVLPLLHYLIPWLYILWLLNRTRRERRNRYAR